MTSATMNELRTEKVSPERRKEIAQLAAAARWLEKRQNGKGPAKSQPKKGRSK